jgi:putative transposase
MQLPAELYTKSPRPYSRRGELHYPFHDRTATATGCGRIRYNRQKINLSTVFAGEMVGVKQVSNKIWLVSVMEYNLGFFDKEQDRVEPGPNPFAPDKLLTMCPE